MAGPSGGSSVSQACAACKHQRRKCSSDCVLAPFFPPHRHAEFLNVHKLFGVRNVMNTVKKVEVSRREDAVRSMIHEAYFRAVDPAGGAYRILNNLQQRYSQMKAELDLVHQQLALFRSIQVDGVENNLMAQSFGDVLQQQSTQSGNQTSNVASPRNTILPGGAVKKEGSSSNRNKEALHYESNDTTKSNNIDENNSSSSSQREENKTNSPEDVKPNVQD